MSLLDRITADTAAIMQNKNDFAIPATLTSLVLPSVTINITGIYTRHHSSYNTDGNRINSLNSNFTFSEDILIEMDYPYRNNGIINLQNHILMVTYKNRIIEHKIQQYFPDELLKIIVCILE